MIIYEKNKTIIIILFLTSVIIKLINTDTILRHQSYVKYRMKVIFL